MMIEQESMKLLKTTTFPDPQFKFNTLVYQSAY